MRYKRKIIAVLLTVDIGNTQTVIGAYDNCEQHSDNLTLISHTVAERSADELGVMIHSLIATVDADLEDVSGVAACSGVPRALTSLCDMTRRYLRVQPMVISSNADIGIPIHYDNPSEVGADRLANTLAAYDLYGGPTVVVDFGTGNNFDVISAEGAFLGGAIAPGIVTSLAALFKQAAALGEVELTEPRNVIGKTTKEAIQSGTLYGFASMIDGMSARFAAELGEICVVATGGLAHLIAPVSKSINHVEPFLTLHGLRVAYQRNRQNTHGQRQHRQNTRTHA